MGRRTWGPGSGQPLVLGRWYIFVSFAFVMDNSFPITPDSVGSLTLETQGMSSGSAHALVAY